MKRLIIVLWVFFFIVNSAFCSEYDKLLKKYKKELKTNKENLEQIQKKIDQKKEEKIKFEREEQLIRKELNRIDKEMNKISSDINKIQSNIRGTQKKLKSTELEMNSAKMQIGQWKDILKKELDQLYRNHYTIDCLIADPWKERLSEYALETKTCQVDLAFAKEVNAENVYKKYTQIQDELNILNSQLTEKQVKQENIRRQKAELFNSTQGSRIAAEEEIKKLNESTIEMRSFIESLEKKKTETTELKKKEELAKKTFQEKKKTFPWPLKGEVTAKFGKNKHAELNTYVISNGIKIKGKQGDVVTAIDSGEVVYAKGFRSYGNTVIIDQGGGIYTIYGQLSEISVDVDAKVKAGDPVGKPGSSTNYTLYFEISVNGQPQDPLAWLNAAGKTEWLSAPK